MARIMKLTKCNCRTHSRNTSRTRTSVYSKFHSNYSHYSHTPNHKLL